MRGYFALIGILLLVMPLSGWQIVEFCPDTYQPLDVDEYLVIEGDGMLGGLTVSDGEGGFRFPSDARAEGRVWIAREGRAFREVHGSDPDYEIFDTDPSIPDVIRGGRFQLSNTGDELLLYQEDQLVEEIRWPGEIRNSEGQIHYREEGVWDPRPLYLGQSRFSPITVDNVSLIAFVAPDCAYAVIARAIEEAGETIRVNAYEFSSLPLARLLLDARSRGVEVEMLLERGPVGGISEAENCVLRLLQESGVRLYAMGAGERHAKYRYDHAKYMIIDNRGVLIGSENFNPTGYPRTGDQGNRGWGAYLEDSRLAGYFLQVYTWDQSGGDVAPYIPPPGLCEPETRDPYPVRFEPKYIQNATVSVVLAPDTSVLIEDLMKGAEERIGIQQATLQNISPETVHPYLEAALERARSGVEVRVILDSYWFNTNEEEDNDEMVAFINRAGDGESLPLSARNAALGSGQPEKVHNKGAIVDDRRVLISSINWNGYSPFYNREAAVIIDSPEAGAYFASVFESDWQAAVPRGSGIDPGKLGAAVAVIGILAGIYILRKRS